jgi:hypothetical protein
MSIARGVTAAMLCRRLTVWVEVGMLWSRHAMIYISGQGMLEVVLAAYCGELAFTDDCFERWP